MGWLPIIGPILQGIISSIASIFNKRADVEIQKSNVELEKKRIDGQVWVKEAELSTQIVRDHDQRLDLRIAQDLVVFPVVVMTALVTWDNIVTLPYPNLVWGIRPFLEGSGFTYLPYAVMTFLLGTIAVNTWKAK